MSDEITTLEFIKEFLIPAIKAEFNILKDRVTKLEKTVRRKTMASKFAREKAAQAWCKPTTEKILMIPVLAEAFAEVIDEILQSLNIAEATNEDS